MAYIFMKFATICHYKIFQTHRIFLDMAKPSLCGKTVDEMAPRQFEGLV